MDNLNPVSGHIMVYRNFSILTDNEYCVRFFADNPVKGQCNKDLIRQTRRGLALVQLDDNVFIGWTKVHSSATPEVPEKAGADRLAPAGVLFLRGRAGRAFQGAFSSRSSQDPRSLVRITHLQLISAVNYRLAGFYRSRRSLWPPTLRLSAESGDIVGDRLSTPSAFTRVSPRGHGTCLYWFVESR